MLSEYLSYTTTSIQVNPPSMENNKLESPHNQKQLLVEKIRKIIKELLLLDQHYSFLEKEIITDADNTEEKPVDETTKELEETLKHAKEIEENVRKISAKLDKLEINPSKDNCDDKEDNEIDLMRELCSNILEEVSTQNCVQSAVSEDLQRQLSEMDQQRLKLLEDLQRQEEAHLRKIEEIQMKNKCDLEDRDMRCLQLEEQIERLRGDNDINLSCSICFEPWSTETEHRLVCLPCGHLFGSTCIREYLHRCPECPQCRTAANTCGIRYLYGRPY